MSTGRKKPLFKRRPMSGEMSLQITSMADIFMILLVFLLKGYTSGAVAVTPTQGLILPNAQAAPISEEALTVEISEKAIQVDGQPVLAIKNFRPAKKDHAQDGSLGSVGEALAKERKRQTLIAQNNPDVKITGRIMILADQRAPYSTIKAVLASAARHGYTDFKLAVFSGE